MVSVKKLEVISLMSGLKQAPTSFKYYSQSSTRSQKKKIRGKHKGKEVKWPYLQMT